ncbi:hypothetical protein [Thalassobaculum litoreum]|uniref:Uncharacterized protein n=1 Tax=Thalassobaculum litoreum DSM 18839 TaxID=1123362 RepID=A0A8G2F3C5_9PROT|nr:hypothetical protein [Thalassobaculum litoreum]SDF84423.1 hypothetical protein SAMN05660686_02510 [Thalassobaculum litoreum DSM 18839]
MEMVERVARRIHTKLTGDPKAWDALTPGRKNAAMDLAREVFDEMKVPTPIMALNATGRTAEENWKLMLRAAELRGPEHQCPYNAGLVREVRIEWPCPACGADYGDNLVNCLDRKQPGRRLSEKEE